MKYCDQCGTKLNDNAKFCSTCGTPVVPDIETPVASRCINCGKPIEEGTSFCANCGELHYEPEKETSKVLEPVVEQKYAAPAWDNEDTQYLADYMERVVLLEKSVYTQTKTTEQLKSHIDGLGYACNYEKPSRPWHKSMLDDTEDLKMTASLGFWGAITGAIFGLFFGSISNGALIGGVGCAVIWMILSGLSAASQNSDADEKYQREMDWYNKATAADEQRVKKELAEKARLSVTLETMEKKRRETMTLLDEYYRKRVIFPKYQNMVAVCSFYEYIMSGRCEALTGHEGAYNIFENEVRLERIYTKLDEVVAKLEEIKTNQYVLYDVIQEGNQLTQRLVDESIQQAQLSRTIAENSELTKFYAERAALCSEAGAWLGVANYLSLEERKK